MKREPKEYVWLWVRNPYANDWNNQSEKELRRYRVKEFKEKCIVLFNGKQYPYDQIVKRESIDEDIKCCDEKVEEGARIYTGCNDKFGKPIFTTDIVKVKWPKFLISGRGVVIQLDDGKFAIRDNRTENECKKRNVGRIYPLYNDAVYTVLETQAEGSGE